MQTKVTKINFNGQNIYIGIDVHLKSWTVTIMIENIIFKTFSMDPSPEILANYVQKNFPGGNYYAAYEAGFCGFSVQREIEHLGIHCIVVNPADIPTKDKEKKQKEDKRDSRKLAKSLHSGDLEGIYIPSKKMEELRGLIRYRKTLVKEICRHKCRIKAYLHLNGIRIPENLNNASQHWSGKFTEWLKTVRLTTQYGDIVLNETLDTTEHLRNKLLKINRQLRIINKDSEHSGILKFIQTVPGIGLIMAITLIAELDNLLRFKSLDKLCSFIGLVPSTNSSGEKERTGSITSRANSSLRSNIVECAWISIRNDPALAYSYNELCKRMKSNEAIIRIAKKLLSRIRYVVKNETEYVQSVI
jgi:transposase